MNVFQCYAYTSAALSAQSLTILAVLLSTRPSVVICSFLEPEQLGSIGGAFSSQLLLSGTHCRFTFAPRHQSQSNPYVTVISLDLKAFDTVRHTALFEQEA